MNDTLSQFRDAICSSGLEPPDIIEPGTLYRFPGIGKKHSNQAGWCKLFKDGNGGCFGDWSSGFTENWQAKREKPFSQSERVAFLAHVAETKKREHEERKKQHINAAKKACLIWSTAKSAFDDHPYLVSKGITANHTRLHNGALVIPMRYEGKIYSLQFISADGSKRFFSGGRISSCYFSMGKTQNAKALCIAEGFATGATIHHATGFPVAVAFNAGNLENVAKTIRNSFPDMLLVICADDDRNTNNNPGISKATQAAKTVNAKLAVPTFGNKRPDNATDFNDMAMLFGNEAVATRINNMIKIPEKVFKWPEIIPLNTTLPEVEKFDYKLLPIGLSNWVKDIVERTHCPPDFVAVTVMVALASLIGRKVAIHPKEHDDWLVTPNLWGALIGRPSAMKSPAMTEGLRPLKRLVSIAHKKYKDEIKEYQVDKMFAKQRATILEQDIKTALRNDDRDEIDLSRYKAQKAIEEEQEQPAEHRYIVNDATIEKLGELLNQNINGLLLERDELSGWLKCLDREDKSNDRAFYLESFNGGGSYTYDRIGRGTIYIESTTISIIGGLQPSKLRPYVWNAINQGAGDDGLIQRFQLAVYPDDLGDWRNVDRWPDTESKQSAYDIFTKLDEIEPQSIDDEGRVLGVRFDKDGQQIFNTWRKELEYKAIAPGIHPAIESHLIKYRSLMPSIALIINEIEQGHCQPVTELSAKKAAAWCQYLESHAMRIYGSAIDPTAQNAEIILKRRKKLQDGFTQRDIHRKGWAGLSEIEKVNAALNELEECGYLHAEKKQSNKSGGRPTYLYYWNPNIKEGA